MRRPSVVSKTAAFVLVAACMAVSAASADEPASAPDKAIALTPCRVEGVQQPARCGIYKVFENRRLARGRTLPLKVVVISAKHPHPEQGPVFYLAGGPGETATELADYVVDLGDADEHDLVLVDERGTGEGHRLDCPRPASDAKGGLRSPFDPDAARACSRELAKRFDLSQYTTANFVEDLDDARRALGYDTINIDAGSFGTYAAQMYIRRYGDHVRSAYLASLVTLSNRVPLDHARHAQEGLDHLFAECERDAACRGAYPHVADDFAALVKKVREQPVRVAVPDPETHTKAEVTLTEASFTDAVRVMMYHDTRSVPYLIEQAKAGDFGPFAEAAYKANHGIYGGLRAGLNFAIVCNEFTRRIRPDDVDPATRGSVFGAWRVKSQMKLCNEWPKTDVPGDWYEPFRSSVPAVLVSGDVDPGSRPSGGEEVKSYMPNAVTIVIPGGAHVPDNDCTREVRRELFEKGTTKSLDLGCVAAMKAAPFRLPAQPASR
jgi:pimeloyl-ACP methyl ester carboxylesterase